MSKNLVPDLDTPGLALVLEPVASPSDLYDMWQAVFSAARPHHAYCFAYRRANRMKVLVYDGFGVWLAARRRNRGKFAWADAMHGPHVELDAAQWHELAICRVAAWRPAGGRHHEPDSVGTPERA